MYDNVKPEDLGQLNAAITLPLERGPAVLVELVDNGPKNKLTVTDIDEAGEVGVNTYVDIPCDVPAGTYMVYRKSLTTNDTNATYSLTRFMSGDTVVKSFALNHAGGVTKVTIASPATKLRIYASDTAAHSSGDSLAVEDFMVCSAADWRISETYQPFRPSYQELYERVVALEDAE